MIYSELEERGIRSGLVWYTNFWIRIICPTFSVLTSSAWKGTRHFLTSTFQPFGRPRIIATDVVTLPAYWKWALAVQCISTSLMPHPRMKEMGRVNKLPKTLGERCVSKDLSTRLRIISLTAFVSFSFLNTSYSSSVAHRNDSYFYAMY